MLQYEEVLTTASDICGELDRYRFEGRISNGTYLSNVITSLLALAQGARKYKFSRPRITEENIIAIKGGR